MNRITRVMLVASALACFGLSLAAGAGARTYVKKYDPSSPLGDDDVPALVGDQGDDNVVVPEPGTMALLGMGLAGLAAARRRKRNKTD